MHGNSTNDCIFGKKGKLLCKYFPTVIQTAVSAKFVIEDKVRNTVF